MDSYVPSKQHLREVLLHNFLLKKSAAKSHRLITENYGIVYSPSLKTCEYWFRRFKNDDFDINDKWRSGAPKKIVDTELEALIAENPCGTQEDFSTALNVSRQHVSQRLHAMGFIQKEGIWTLQGLSPEDHKHRKRNNKSSKPSVSAKVLRSNN